MAETQNDEGNSVSTEENTTTIEAVDNKLTTSNDDDQREPAQPAQLKTVQSHSQPIQESETHEPKQQSVEESVRNQLEQINSDLSGLGAKFEDGKIDFRDYHSQMLRLNERKSGLTNQAARFQVQEQIIQNDWSRAQDRFLVNNKNYQNPILYAALDGAIKQLANNSDAVGKSYEWLLEEGKKAVDQQLGVGINQQQTQVKESESSTLQIPQTLGGVPASGNNPTNPDGFSRLDRLDGMTLENELSKMSPADVERYLQG